MADKYLGMSEEKFVSLTKRYMDFHNASDDLNSDPVNVFSPISEKSMADLLLNRGVSQDLQKKKEDDMKKQAQAAEETKEEKLEQKSEDTAEEKTPEEAKK